MLREISKFSEKLFSRVSQPNCLLQKLRKVLFMNLTNVLLFFENSFKMEMLSKRSYLEAVIRTSAEKCYLLDMSETKELARRCTIKKEFLKIWQNTQENTCAKVFFSIKL